MFVWVTASPSVSRASSRIDVEMESRVQVGALSFVPKHSRLSSGVVYVGIPIKPLHPPAILGTK
ncbi:MAG: hypothetical protein QM736_25345 [Vicinamibacterales bacterium]